MHSLPLPNNTIELQSEWHCYNLKRKVAALPPLTLEDFEKRKAVADADKAKLDTKEKKKNHHKELKAKKQKKKEEEMETEEVLEKRWKNGDNPRSEIFGAKTKSAKRSIA